MTRFERTARRVRKQLRRHPTLTPVVDRVGLFVWKQRIRRLGHGQRRTVDPRRHLYVRPDAIHLALDRAKLLDAVGLTNRRDLVGVEAGGNWDTEAFTIHQVTHLEAFRQRFEDKIEWADIPFFREIEQSIREGRPDTTYRYRTVEDLHRRWAHADALYDNIERNGYLTQEALGTKRPWEEVLIAFDRRGRIMFVDGIHRLAIARALKIERIPTLAAARHLEWNRFAAGLRAEVHDSGGRSYQPILHPDLDDIPSHKGHDRFELIERELPIRSGSLLDIGANRGYFCHRFEDVGFDCVAVERSLRETFFLRRLRDAGEKRFEIIEGSIEQTDFREHNFSVVLALNIFHHFLKTQSGFEALREFLRRLNTKYLVFEPHLPDESQMRGAYRNLTPSEFTRFVMEHAGLSSCDAIGKAHDGRTLFILSR